MTMNLDEAFRREETGWVPWEKGGFEVEVKYVARSVMRQLIKDCQSVRYENHQKVEEIDEDRFKRKISDLLVGWRGLTVAKARKLINLKDGLKDDELFECTPANKTFALREFYGFDEFILDAAKNLHERKEAGQEEQEKN
jgi:hypothetical protein